MERRRWDERYAAPDRNPLRDPNTLVVDELSSFDLVLATFFHPRPSERPALYPS